jgi:16S rRNA (guanine(966)-N(2))-methyltransferase RsmD
MRVIAGTARSRRLEALPGEDITRPTIDRVKEAMFSGVQFLVPGARVLDLFAGSGQLGIEALSRGAKSCTFLDASRQAVEVVVANCKSTGLFDRSRISTGDAFTFLASTRDTFDLVLLDPPFGHGTLAAVLPALAPHVAAGGVVLCESELEAQLPPAEEGLVRGRQYRYGKILVTRYEKEELL